MKTRIHTKSKCCSRSLNWSYFKRFDTIDVRKVPYPKVGVTVAWCDYYNYGFLANP